MKYIIIGGVAGGATAAARLRRNNEQAEIVMFERGDFISYANCGLPYYLGGVIPERDRLFVQTPESFYATFRVDVRTRTEVLEINRDDKTVTVRDGEGKEYQESYDKLVLSPGAEPIRPPIPGINGQGIFTLRSVPDIDKIVELVETRKPRRAVIVGAGFIGLEMAENLHRRGVFVTIVEMANQVMNILDYEMAAAVHQHLKVKNVEFYLQDGVASFTANGGHTTVALKSGRQLDADLVILSIGVKPDTDLARGAGLSVGKTGGIVVDKYLQTSDPDIYAVGDAIEFKSPITGRASVIPLAGPANKQARIAADNISFGNTRSYPGAIGTGIAKVFDLTVASTGASEKLLQRENVPYLSVVTHSSSHAGYYPNAIPMSIKTIFSPSGGRILGAQVVGYEGVDKRIDLLASVLRNSGTIYDLQELEHAYAPPFSSAKDPVNIAGFVAENVLTGRSRHIHWDELLQVDSNEYFLIDVRTPEEYAIDTIEGAINIPVDTIRDRLDEIPRDKKIVVFCGVGFRAYLSERILRQNGFEEVSNLSGGFKTYSLATQKQSNEDIFEGDYVGKDDTIYQVDPFSSEREASLATPTNGSTPSALKEIVQVDASGLQCPGPILRLKTELDKQETGTRLLETATDPGFARDIQAWTRMTGNRLVELHEEAGTITALVEKAAREPSAHPRETENALTMVVFSDSLDRALASFVIANGAASAGKEVTMFFTFWGLSILKKETHTPVKKDFMGRMFSMMLPGSTGGLSLSKMNMGGMGARMMRSRMKAKNVDSLEQMMQTAIDSGVRLVACQMSMDIMGISREELLDNVEIGGVASYLESASDANANLFV